MNKKINQFVLVHNFNVRCRDKETYIKSWDRLSPKYDEIFSALTHELKMAQLEFSAWIKLIFISKQF